MQIMRKPARVRQSHEISLYLPVKRFLEGLGFAVKGEICGCDLVAVHGADTAKVVIGELKQSFTLDLILQAVDRMAMSDEVWLAVRSSKRGRGREHDPRTRKLCRLLGVGLLTVSTSGAVEVLVTASTWRPRRDVKRRSRILDEHRRRRGDPTLGGSTRAPIMTAYRQQALACAAAIARGPVRPRDLKPDMPDAPKILLRNVYGWFVRIERGLYELSDTGRAAVARTVSAEYHSLAANQQREGEYQTHDNASKPECDGVYLTMEVGDPSE